jgi:hypothetical protein
MLIFTCANAQLIGEGDTLWYKSLSPNTISKVQFSPDGTKLAVFSALDLKKYLNVYDAISGEELWRIDFPFFANNFQFSLEGDLIFVLAPSEKTVFGYNSQNGEIVEQNTYGNETQQTYWNLFLTPDTNKFLFTSPTGKNAIYDRQKKSIILEKLNSDNSQSYSSPYSNYYLKADDYESGGEWIFTVSIWDLKTLEFVSNLVREPGVIDEGEAKISYNGKYAATNFGGRALQIWDLENKKLFKEYPPTIPTHTTNGTGGQLSLAFCYDNELLINCGGDYLFDTKGSSTTITNIINNKRALMIDTMAGALSLDVNKNDNLIAYPRNGQNIVVYKLHKDAVPVEEYSKEIQDTIYPNPTIGNITINIPQKYGFINAGQIFDNSGKIVKTYLLNELLTSESKLTLNLNEISNGVYILKLTSANDILTYKIILEK